VLLQDVASLAALVGLRRWFDPERWFAYKVLHTPEADLELGRSLTAMVRALYGRSRKVLVLDLDNTCWGGVIGDDGVDGIVIGRETPQAEAFTAFQQHCLALRARGVLLAVCSKNDDAVARSGFAHPDSVLRLEHFSCFQANWQPKPLNLLAMADELALGLESFVFVDDNPAEREMVRAQLPAVAVPEVGCEPARFVEILQAGRYFEPATLSAEDLGRAALYEQRAAAQTQQARFGSYGEYLDSLGMVGEIDTFRPVYMERIAQLTNKSNQFNLTTRRFTRAQLEEAAADPASIALYGRLADKFGDNGLVAVVMGTQQGREFRIELWLMSCRVLKRDMEHAMLDALVERARSRGVETLIGVYLPSAKNGMVRDFYAGLGFEAGENDASLPAGSTTWRLELAGYQARNTHIRVLEFAHV
jgi:FkbH-like protein